jgi:hypothetical protein
MTAQEKILWQEIDQVSRSDFDEGDEGEKCKASTKLDWSVGA